MIDIVVIFLLLFIPLFAIVVWICIYPLIKKSFFKNITIEVDIRKLSFKIKMKKK